MSRFLLALKACFSQIDPVATFVFDEVDVGVSGRVAQAIAEKLHHLSHTHQILCVTHQPIIAAIADQHFHVEKAVISNSAQDTEAPETRTIVRIQQLTEAQRPQELAQLAGGSSTDQMLAFATSLIAQANQIRHPNAKAAAEPKPLAKIARAQAKTRKRAS